MGRLDQLDLSLSLSKEEEMERLEVAQERLTALRLALVDFERSFAVESGVMVKFWLHVSEEEQLDRFEKRQANQLKSWKITEDDWRNREKRPAYAEAIEEMLERTDHDHAPWQLVEGDSKRWARVKIIETVIAEVERGMRERDFPVPPAP